MASACTMVLANDGSGGGLIGGQSGAGFRAVRASSCLLMTLAVAGAGVLVIAGVLVVREFSLSAGYEPAVCRVENVTYAARDAFCVHCTTAAGEKGKQLQQDRASATNGAGACVTVAVPCLLVTVVYGRPGTAETVRALLHTDSIQAAGSHNQCSFSVCHKTRDENQLAAEEFAESWRQKAGLAAATGSSTGDSPPSAPPPDQQQQLQTDSEQLRPEELQQQQQHQFFECFYDTTDSSRVIYRKTYTRSDVIHCMLWPSLVVLVSVAVFLYLEARRSRLTCCGRRASVADDVDEEKSGLKAASGGTSGPAGGFGVARRSSGNIGKTAAKDWMLGSGCDDANEMENGGGFGANNGYSARASPAHSKVSRDGGTPVAVGRQLQLQQQNSSSVNGLKASPLLLNNSTSAGDVDTASSQLSMRSTEATPTRRGNSGGTSTMPGQNGNTGGDDPAADNDGRLRLQQHRHHPSHHHHQQQQQQLSNSATSLPGVASQRQQGPARVARVPQHALSVAAAADVDASKGPNGGLTGGRHQVFMQRKSASDYQLCDV